MRFVAAELFRVTAPGCNVCIHLQTLLAYKNQHGFSGRRDFRGAMVDVFGVAGFEWTAEVAIPKNPQSMAQRLNLHSLQFKTGHSRSATDWGMAPNDYVMVFQKPGEIAVPVRPLAYKPGLKPESRLAFFERTGTKDDAAYVALLRKWAEQVDAINPGGWLSADDWIVWAKGTWEDIDEIDVLDGARSKSHKEASQEKHVCPLQLEVIRRCVLMYSNPISIQPDVLVLDPFLGIGSTAYVALGGHSPMTKLCVDEPRNTIGFELKESYYRGALANIEKAKKGEKEPTFEDYLAYMADQQEGEDAA